MMSTHTTIGAMQYATGDWFVVAKENGFVLLPGHVAVATLERVWTAVDSGRIAAVIDAMTATAGAPLSAVPPFAIAIRHGADLRIAVRGDVRVVYDDGTRQELITGGRMETWVEQELPAHVALLVTPPESQIDETLLPLVSGIARAGLVAVGTQEHPTQAATGTASVGTTADTAAIDAPTPADAEQGEAADPEQHDGDDVDDHKADGDAGATAGEGSAEGEDSAGEGSAEGEDGAGEGSAEGGGGGGGGVVDGGVAGDGATVVDATDTAVVDDAGEHVAPEAAEPDPTTGQHDMTPDGGTGDHDGQTVEQSFLDAARAAGMVADTDPDAAQTSAGFDDAPDFFAEFGIDLDGDRSSDEGGDFPDGAPGGGRVVLSTGAVLELDRPLIVGRRPRIEQGMSDDIPELITVASPTHDISRNHVEIRRDGEATTVTDLNTTNGTMLLREGDGPLRLHPGEPTMVLSGDVLDIGDDVTLRFEDIP
ncbi:FHA domain-containing protein [Microbacterium sp. ZW T5_56]|uniref:FHA domain-containing protein n=1 Tax=Microbacterium sp. ZW T5_56 TaxID=3378081 RepID=UPI003851C8C7